MQFDPRHIEEMLYDEETGPRASKHPFWLGRSTATREWEDPYAIVDLKVSAARLPRSEWLAAFGFVSGSPCPVNRNSFANYFRDEVAS